MYRSVIIGRIVRTVAASAIVWALATAASAQGRPRSVAREHPADPKAAEQKPSGDQRAGQPRGPGKWWQVYKAELRLTPDQVTRIDAIFDATFPQLRASYEELNKREEQLSSLISANDATEAQVLKQADQIEAIRSELSKTRVLMLFRMRRVLSPEQRDKLQELQKERFGGPPPPRR